MMSNAGHIYIAAAFRRTNTFIVYYCRSTELECLIRLRGECKRILELEDVRYILFRSIKIVCGLARGFKDR
jgi:hypothetical protein